MNACNDVVGPGFETKEIRVLSDDIARCKVRVVKRIEMLVALGSGYERMLMIWNIIRKLSVDAVALCRMQSY